MSTSLGRLIAKKRTHSVKRTECPYRTDLETHSVQTVMPLVSVCVWCVCVGVCVWVCMGICVGVGVGVGVGVHVGVCACGCV